MGPLLVILGRLSLTGCGLGIFMYAGGHSQANYLVPVLGDLSRLARLSLARCIFLSSIVKIKSILLAPKRPS